MLRSLSISVFYFLWQGGLKAQDLINHRLHFLSEKHPSQLNIIMFLVITILVLMIILVAVGYHSYMKNRKTNHILETQKKRIEERNDELVSLKEEIRALSEELENANIRLGEKSKE